MLEPQEATSPQEATPLDSPRDGLPDLVSDPAGLAAAVAALRAGSGPAAVDAERASGHRYGQRAFLVQVRREGSGTWLIDPAVLPDLSPLGAALSGTEWILHAAAQDLPCLADVGMIPDLLFDTELGGRLAGYPRVGLAAMVEELLGLRLAKEHSAVDWSVRPLPESWLRYAALDVEVLIDLRAVLAADLQTQGKLDWAREEFAAVLAAPPPVARVDPWRRTSGLHRVRDRRKLAAVRELWTARDDLARDKDVSPGRLIPDSAVIEAARHMPVTAADLAALRGFTGRASRSHLRVWQAAVDRARRVDAEDLPPLQVATDGPPPPRVWAERDPQAAARLAACRAALTSEAERHRIPVENLLAPDAVRRLAWEPPDPVGATSVRAALQAHGARRWQVELTVPLLTTALTTALAAALAADPPAAG